MKQEPKKNIKPEPKTKVINEVPKKHKVDNNKIKEGYKLILVYHGNDLYISVKPEQKVSIIYTKLSKMLNVPAKNISLNYRENDITEKYHNLTIKEFFNFPINKSRPIIYVQIKQKYSPDLNNELQKYSIFNKKNYDNKVKIANYPNLYNDNVGINDDINNVINTFMNSMNLKFDFTCDRKEIDNNKSDEEEEKKNADGSNVVYYIGFPSPDISFDFNRYMNYLKLTEPKFKNIKVNIVSSKKVKNNRGNTYDNDKPRGHKLKFIDLNEPDINKRNIEVISAIRYDYINNKMNSPKKGKENSEYLNTFSPYITPMEISYKEHIENKKKWITPEGFFQNVGNYKKNNI